MAGILQNGPGAADEVRSLFDRVQPTLPIVLANLVSLGEVAVTYQPSLEQLLVLLPQGTAVTQAVGVHKRNTKQDYEGDALTFNLNLMIPWCRRRSRCRRNNCRRRAPPVSCPPSSSGCPRSRTIPTGRPATSTAESRRTRRSTSAVRATCPASRCRANVPRHGSSAKATRTTCRSTTATTGRVTRTRRCPGRRSRMCRPEPPPAQAAPPPGPAPPPIAAAEYDPATGTYVGPDGRVYTQANLANSAAEEQTWQTMLLPPTGN